MDSIRVLYHHTAEALKPKYPPFIMTNENQTHYGRVAVHCGYIPPSEKFVLRTHWWNPQILGNAIGGLLWTPIIVRCRPKHVLAGVAKFNRLPNNFSHAIEEERNFGTLFRFSLCGQCYFSHANGISTANAGCLLHFTRKLLLNLIQMPW